MSDERSEPVPPHVEGPAPGRQDPTTDGPVHADPGGIQVRAEFRDLIPPLSPEELAGLESSLLAEGGARDALVIWRETGALLDGHHRLRLCSAHNLPYSVRELSFQSQDEAMVWVIQNQFSRRNLTPYVRAELALKLEPLIAAKAKERQVEAGKHGAEGGRGNKKTLPKISAEGLETRQEVAKAAGLSHDTIAKVKAISRKADEETKAALRSGEVSIHQVATQLKREEKTQKREAERRANEQKVAEAPDASLLEGVFSTIVVDAPWDNEEPGTEDAVGPEGSPLPSLSEAELADLPVAERANPKCHLYLWATSGAVLSGKAARLCEGWGFKPVALLTWCKPSRGHGRHFKSSTEHLVFAVRGTLPLRTGDHATDFSWGAVKEPRHLRSEEVYELIEECSPGPYLEMYARRPRQGWTSWGAEAQE